MGRSTDKETGLSEQRKYRSWTAQQKLELVLAGLRGDRTVKGVCREHQISDTLYYSWRQQADPGRARGAGREGGAGRPAGAASEGRGAGAGARPQDVRAGDRGESLGGLGVSVCVAWSRRVVAEGLCPGDGGARDADQPGTRSTGCRRRERRRSGDRSAIPSRPRSSRRRSRTRATATGWSAPSNAPSTSEWPMALSPPENVTEP